MITEIVGVDGGHDSDAALEVTRDGAIRFEGAFVAFYLCCSFVVGRVVGCHPMKLIHIVETVALVGFVVDCVLV